MYPRSSRGVGPEGWGPFGRVSLRFVDLLRDPVDLVRLRLDGGEVDLDAKDLS